VRQDLLRNRKLNIFRQAFRQGKVCVQALAFSGLGTIGEARFYTSANKTIFVYLKGF
jgi:hypothetical protein